VSLGGFFVFYGFFCAKDVTGTNESLPQFSNILEEINRWVIHLNCAGPAPDRRLSLLLGADFMMRLWISEREYAFSICLFTNQHFSQIQPKGG